jgi:WD repeat-containing protein 26
MRFHSVQALFHENAATIFPGIKSKIIDIDQHKPKTKKAKATARTRSNSRAVFLRPVFTVAPDPETLPQELVALAQDVKAFLEHLEEFPEFVDEALNASITAFECDLRVSFDFSSR